MTNQEPTAHVLPLKLYLTVAGTLLTLTAITVWVSQYDLGSINLLVAMIVAATKGTLVALYFMHLKYTDRLYSMVIVVAVLVLAAFIILTMFDTMYRGSVDQIKDGIINDRAIIYPQETADSLAADSVASPDTSLTRVDSAGQ